MVLCFIYKRICWIGNGIDNSDEMENPGYV